VAPGRGVRAAVGALSLLTAWLLPHQRSFAQDALRLGPEIRLADPPPEDREDDLPLVAWDGTAFVLLTHQWRDEGELPVSEHLMGGRLSSTGEFLDRPTELAIEGCATPESVACDRHERCLLACSSPIYANDRSRWLALIERLSVLWSGPVEPGLVVVAWDGRAFVVVHGIRDRTVPLTYVDPDAPAAARDLRLPPLPEEYVPAKCWPVPAGATLLVFCVSGSVFEGRAAVLRVESDGHAGQWLELPNPVSLSVQDAGGTLIAAWVDVILPRRSGQRDYAATATT